MQCVPLFLQVDFATYIFGHFGGFDHRFKFHTFVILSNYSLTSAFCAIIKGLSLIILSLQCVTHMDSPMDKSNVRLLDSLIDGHSNFEVTVYHHLVLPASIISNDVFCSF